MIQTKNQMRVFPQDGCLCEVARGCQYAELMWDYDRKRPKHTLLWQTRKYTLEVITTSEHSIYYKCADTHSVQTIEPLWVTVKERGQVEATASPGSSSQKRFTIIMQPTLQWAYRKYKKLNKSAACYWGWNTRSCERLSVELGWEKALSTDLLT